MNRSCDVSDVHNPAENILTNRCLLHMRLLMCFSSLRSAVKTLHRIHRHNPSNGAWLRANLRLQIAGGGCVHRVRISCSASQIGIQNSAGAYMQVW